MLAKVTKMIPGAGGDFAGRFGAWWSGKDYVPPPPAEEGSVPPEAAAAPAAVASMEPHAAVEADAAPVQPSAIRIKALGTIWGEGRFTPGTHELDTKLLDPLFDTADAGGAIGFIGVDPAVVRAAEARTGRKLHALEWRSACLDALREIPELDVISSEIDRPKGFVDGSLEGLVSIDAFAYADHKAGLVARAFRALSETGTWAFLDTTRTTTKTPPEPFASAWAEPQLTHAGDIENLLAMSGFKSVSRVSVTEEVVYAARAGYARLAYALEEAASGGLKGREGAIFLQELAWEAQAWRARMRALEGGALGVDLWIARKKEPEPKLGKEPGLDPMADALFS